MDREECRHVWLAVIAGGRGTRLFPISHEGCPKQFCDLNKSQKFIQATIQRFLDLGVSPTQIVIVTTNENQTQLARSQTRELGILGQNVYALDEAYGYPGVMVRVAELIAKHDPEAIIINTPSDQYIIEDDDFERAVENSVEIASEGKVAIIGAKVTELVTATGCGHVIYDPAKVDETGFSKMTDFIEKPEKKIADHLMRSGSSACNTGINVWRVDTLLKDITSAAIKRRQSKAREKNQKWELGTDTFLKKLSEVYVTAGTFSWHDCGTLSALYEISPKTPNHKNASVGKGEVDRTDCLRNLFYAPEGFRLHVTGFRDAAVVANVVEVNGEVHPIVCITKLSESQRVKELAEDITTSQRILSVDFQIMARNNSIMRSNVSDDTIFGFVGVKNCIINVYKNTDGVFDVYASQQKTEDVRARC